MCGISGIVDWKKQNNHLNTSSILRKMGDSMVHRGPDDFGIYENEENIVGLVHRRLSILDLTQLGHQPMILGRYAMVYNGEVFNFKEIRDTLLRLGVSFSSNSDTEVILQAYIHYGVECFSHFNGMYAIAIWDNVNRELILVRDRIGIKPLYYYCQNDIILFASEIKTLFAYPLAIKVPNEEAIYNYLFLGHQLDDQTWFKGVKTLKPGTYARFTEGKTSHFTFWQPKVEIDYSRSYNSFKDELRSTIIDAIKLHQISDVPVGAHLSGGVDSSTIVSIAAGQFNSPLHTFSSTFEGLGIDLDETDEIELVHRTFGTIHHKIFTEPTILDGLIPSLIAQADEPSVGPAMIPMYFVNKAVRDHGVIVVNGGHGVDEMFGGYPPSYAHAAHSLIDNAKKGRIIPGELFRIPHYLYKSGSLNRFFSKRRIQVSEWLNVPNERNAAIGRYNVALNDNLKGNTLFDAHMLMMLKHYLPGLLHQEDRMSMISSVESRVPFLDNRLVDLSLTIPFYFKVRNGVTKCIFRDSMKGIVPDAILFNRLKRGYPTPISLWSRNELSEFFKSILLSEKSYVSGFFDKNALSLLLDDHFEMKSDNISILWPMLCTEIWFKNNFS